METLNDLKDLIIAKCGNWSIVLRIEERDSGWNVPGTVFEPFLQKVQIHGYDNGPLPADDGKEVPLRHIMDVMHHETLSFEKVIQSQFNKIDTVLYDETLYDKVSSACRAETSKVINAIVDLVNNMTPQEVYALARSMHIKVYQQRHEHDYKLFILP